MTVRIQLLGDLSVWQDDRPIVLPTRKAAGLLAVLASRPDAPLSRERAAALLWSRSAEPQARSSLRQALVQLRRALGDREGTIIETQGDGLRLAGPDVEIDAVALEADVSSGTPERLAEAAARYAGDFLEGFALNEEPFEEWRRSEAARLRELAMRGFQRLLAHHVDAGNADAAMRLGERLLALDPASEEVHRALTRLHVDRGEVSAAMRQYERCRATLERELGVRPSDEMEMLRRRALDRPRPSPESGEDAPPSIAVLPFTDLSDDSGGAYFAQGLAEDMIRELSRFRPLSVVSRHSSFVFADGGLPPREIGERLGVRYLLLGSLRKVGGAIRIGVELVQAETSRQVWAHRYDIGPESLFEVQDEIARGVAGALAIRIDEEMLRQARRKPLEDLQAYDCWLRGIACLRRATPESHDEARTLFRRALDADPHFARAYAGLSLTHFNDWSCNAWDRWDENERHAFQYACQAVDLDDTDHIAQLILGRVLLYRRDFERAEQHLRRAEALNPNDADALVHLALAYGYLGLTERGIEAGRTAMRLNPFHDDWYFAFGAAPYLIARRLEEGIALALKAPDAATDVRAHLAAAYAHLGRLEEARRLLADFLVLFRRNIAFGRLPEPDEPARWLVRVNPFKRASDMAYWMDGFRKAGLLVPADLARVA